MSTWNECTTIDLWIDRFCLKLSTKMPLGIATSINGIKMLPVIFAMSVRGSFKIWRWFLEESIIALIMYCCKTKQQLFYCLCTFTGHGWVVFLLCVIWPGTAVIWGLDCWWWLEGWSRLECRDDWASLSPNGLRISSAPCGLCIWALYVAWWLRPPIEYKSRNCLMFLRQ